MQKYGKGTSSLKYLQDTIECFSKVAGPKLNIDKTECILIYNSFINIYEIETFIEGIKINRYSIKSLGVYLGHDRIKCYKKNWSNKLEKLSRVLSVWKKPNLTIFGKCMIINTKAISKLVYNASILKNPTAEFLKTVSKVIFSFFF